MEKVTLNVSNMTCGHCEKAVKNTLFELDGVHAVEVYLKEGKVDIQYDSVDADLLKDAIEEQGYDIV